MYERSRLGSRTVTRPLPTLTTPARSSVARKRLTLSRDVPASWARSACRMRIVTPCGSLAGAASATSWLSTPATRPGPVRKDRAAIPPQRGVRAGGLTLNAGRTLLAGRLYRLKALDLPADAYGRAFRPDFSLLVRNTRAADAIALVTADLDRNGEPELIALFADGSVGSLSGTADYTETLLPPSEFRGIALTTGDFDGNGAQAM